MRARKLKPRDLSKSDAQHPRPAWYPRKESNLRQRTSQPRVPSMVGGKKHSFGPDDWNRTSDIMVVGHALLLLSYARMIVFVWMAGIAPAAQWL